MTGADWLTVVAALFGVLPAVAGIVWLAVESVRKGNEEK